MATRYEFEFEPINKIISPSNFNTYYYEPEKLEQRLKSYLLARWNNQDIANKFSLENVAWHEDFKKLSEDLLYDNPLDYEILNKWCEIRYYGEIVAGHYLRRYPEPDTVNYRGLNLPEDPFGNVVGTNLLYSWKVERLDNSVVIEDYRENSDNFIFAFVNLVIPHLFFVFHATRNKVKNYLVEVYKCNNIARCNNVFFAINKRGTKPKYCSQKCRTYTNTTNARKIKRKQEKDKKSA